jgi:hypothetical protein
LKKLCWNCLKFILLSVISISSSLAIYMHYKGSAFDPVREILQLTAEHRRDDALDIARFFKENQINDQGEFAQIEKDLEYTVANKLKSFLWDGAIRGQVYDSYSGMGAISADLCVIGDIRDLGIQGWKYLTGGQDFDGYVTILSAAGIGLSTTPFLDGTNALAKSIFKYLKRIPASINKGMLKEFLTEKLSPTNYKKIWVLLKKTAGRFPAPYPALAIFTT